MTLETFANSAQTTITADVTGGALTISVAGFASFPNSGQFRIKIDSEIMLVTAGMTTTTWTVTRGVEGTSIATHTNGATVTHILTAAAMLAAFQQIDTVSNLTAGANLYIKGPSPWFDVKANGAVGDGVTNDTTAIAATITLAAAQANGGTVYFPPGTYLHSGLTLPQYVSLAGAGMNFSILKYSGVTIAITATTDWSFGCIRDLQFTTSSSPTGACISNHNIERTFNIERVRISGHLLGIDLWQSINVRISDCYVAGQGGQVAGGQGITLGNGANVSTTTTIEDTYVTDYYTGILNNTCVGLVCIRPVIEYYSTGIYSLSKMICLWGYTEAGYVGKTSVRSEDMFIDLGGTWETVPTLASVGTSRYVSVGSNINSLGGLKTTGAVTLGAALVRSRQTPTEAVLVSGVDVTAGDIIEPAALTAARAVGAPLNPTTGQVINFIFLQDGTGARAVTWNAVFKVSWSDTGNSANRRSTISFMYNGANWIQEGAQSPYLV